MKKVSKYLNYPILGSLLILTIYILFREWGTFDFNLEKLILLFAFLGITIIFEILTTIKKFSNQNFIFTNFNFALIFLTNPFFSFLFSLGYGIFKIIHIKDMKLTKFLYIFYMNFFSSYIGYILIKSYIPTNELILTPKLLLICLLSFAIAISLSLILNIILNYIEIDAYSISNYKDKLVENFIQILLISLFVTPLIVVIYNFYGYSGIVFPIGLMFVLTYSFKLMFERQMELQEFKELSYRDGLTGVYNRRYLEEFLDSASSLKEPITLIMMDIDKFKSVNDNYNHSVGDQVLKHFSLVLRNCIRSNDVLARYGGEEFVIILTEISPEQSKLVAERIRASVEASFARVNFNGNKVNVRYTTSLGVVYTHAERSYHLKEALKEADRYLYASKHNGRNCITSNI